MKGDLEASENAADSNLSGFRLPPLTLGILEKLLTCRQRIEAILPSNMSSINRDTARENTALLIVEGMEARCDRVGSNQTSLVHDAGDLMREPLVDSIANFIADPS